MYASGPVVKNDLLGLALRGNYYNREASNIKYGDGEVVSARGPSQLKVQTGLLEKIYFNSK